MTAPSEAAQIRRLRQPKGLYVLFLTETWERFSFFGMQALLIFYLTQHFLLSDAEAYQIFGSYVALVYTAPILGGLVADRWLGLRKGVLLGGIMLAIGHFGMAFEGHAAVRTVTADGAPLVQRDDLALQTMYLSLALIALGTGFLKPNISAALGRLYDEQDPRRDSGFTLFFLGINLGGLLSALVVGYLGQGIGWRYGFGAAGVGMFIGLAIFVLGQKHLEGRAEAPVPERLRHRVFGPLSFEILIYLAVAVAVLLAWQLIQFRPVLTAVMAAVSVAVIGWLVWFIATQCTREERDRMIAAFLLTLAAIVFFVAVLQAGTTMGLYLQRNVDRHIVGFELEAAQFGVFAGLFVILLAPLFSAFWLRLGRHGAEPGTVTKMGAGMMINGAGFAVMGLAGVLAGGPTAVAAGWIVLAIALNSAGELLVSPTGLSMISKLSAPRVVGLMMGIWFLGAACAGLISSAVASLAAVDPSVAADKAAGVALGLYINLFFAIGGALALVGVVLLMARPTLNRMMHGAD